MRTNKRIIFLLCSILLTACSPIYQTNYTYSPPHSENGKICLNNCLALQESCQKMCREQNTKCEISAKEQARSGFNSYVIQQKTRNNSIHLKVNDFIYDSQCNQPCNCIGIYNQCYTNCGGMVSTTQACGTFCGTK